MKKRTRVPKQNCIMRSINHNSYQSRRLLLKQLQNVYNTNIKAIVVSVDIVSTNKNEDA